MAWIKTVPMDEADEKLRSFMEAQRGLYPIEYATPVQPLDRVARPASWLHIHSFPTRSITPSRPSAR